MSESISTLRIKVANRITDMLCRLNEGKALDTKLLAQEYSVDRRTIQRDIASMREALPMLDANDQGHHALPANYLGQLNFDDIRHFATLVGVSDLFPSMDRQSLRRILDKDAKHIYESKGQFNEDGDKFKGLFDQLEPAILQKYKVSIYYKGSYHLLEPYKLISHRGCWYLAAAKEGVLKAFRMGFVQSLNVHDDQASFISNNDILKQLADENNIWFGQDKQQAILTISAEVASYFKQRTLLPDQQISRELDDGSLIVESYYVHSRQILSLIRYWMPHIRVVKPDSLRDSLREGLMAYYELSN